MTSAKQKRGEGLLNVSSRREIQLSRMPLRNCGGVGNIQAVDEAKQRISSALEANQDAAELPQPPALRTASLEKQGAQSIQFGRGDAGNYCGPQILSPKARFNDLHSSRIPGDGALQPPNKPEASKSVGSGPISYMASKLANVKHRSYGRGGAGNYADGISNAVACAAKRKMDNGLRTEKLHETIERSVGQRLAVPAKAKLPDLDAAAILESLDCALR